MEEISVNSAFGAFQCLHKLEQVRREDRTNTWSSCRKCARNNSPIVSVLWRRVSWGEGAWASSHSCPLDGQPEAHIAPSHGQPWSPWEGVGSEKITYFKWALSLRGVSRSGFVKPDGFDAQCQGALGQALAAPSIHYVTVGKRLHLFVPWFLYRKMGVVTVLTLLGLLWRIKVFIALLNTQQAFKKF